MVEYRWSGHFWRNRVGRSESGRGRENGAVGRGIVWVWARKACGMVEEKGRAL